MKPIFDYLEKVGLDPEIALFLTIILVGLGWHIKNRLSKARALYVDLPLLTAGELKLMQAKDPACEGMHEDYFAVTAQEDFDSHPSEKQKQLKEAYWLHNKVQLFQTNTYWERYKNFVESALNAVRRITGEDKSM